MESSSKRREYRQNGQHQDGPEVEITISYAFT